MVRINPLAPTSAPETINTLLRITNPAAQAASPEKLFSKAITTGISAPPIGITKRTPNIKAKEQIRINSSTLLKLDNPRAIISNPTSTRESKSKELTICCPL